MSYETTFTWDCKQSNDGKKECYHGNKGYHYSMHDCAEMCIIDKKSPTALAALLINYEKNHGIRMAFENTFLEEMANRPEMEVAYNKFFKSKNLLSFYSLMQILVVGSPDTINTFIKPIYGDNTLCVELRLDEMNDIDFAYFNNAYSRGFINLKFYVDFSNTYNLSKARGQKILIDKKLNFLWLIDIINTNKNVALYVYSPGHVCSYYINKQTKEITFLESMMGDALYYNYVNGCLLTYFHPAGYSLSFFYHRYFGQLASMYGVQTRRMNDYNCAFWTIFSCQLFAWNPTQSSVNLIRFLETVGGNSLLLSRMYIYNLFLITDQPDFDKSRIQMTNPEKYSISVSLAKYVIDNSHRFVNLTDEEKYYLKYISYSIALSKPDKLYWAIIMSYMLLKDICEKINATPHGDIQLSNIIKKPHEVNSYWDRRYIKVMNAEPVFQMPKK